MFKKLYIYSRLHYNGLEYLRTILLRLNYMLKGKQIIMMDEFQEAYDLVKEFII